MTASETQTLTIGLLGSFELRAGETRVLLPAESQRLVALVALSQRPIPTPRLAEALFPSVPDDRALRNLRCGLWRLAQTRLPLVQSLKDEVSLAASLVVDVHQVTREAEQALRAPSAHGVEDFDLRPLLFDLLTDWHDDWVQMERERFRHFRLQALERLSRHWAAKGWHDKAVEAARAAVAAEPLRESAQLALVSALIEGGDLPEAIAGYSSYRALLSRELALAPSPLMEDLIRAAADRRLRSEAATESDRGVAGTTSPNGHAFSPHAVQDTVLVRQHTVDQAEPSRPPPGPHVGTWSR